MKRVTVLEAAKLLHVSKMTVHRMIDRGELVAHRAGNRYVITLESVERA